MKKRNLFQLILGALGATALNAKASGPWGLPYVEEGAANAVLMWKSVDRKLMCLFVFPREHYTKTSLKETMSQGWIYDDFIWIKCHDLNKGERYFASINSGGLSQSNVDYIINRIKYGAGRSTSRPIRDK